MRKPVRASDVAVSPADREKLLAERARKARLRADAKLRLKQGASAFPELDQSREDLERRLRGE